jgi:hypothetical protein
VFARGIVPVLRARKNAIAAEFSMFATRTSFYPVLRDGMMKGFQLNMQRMEDRWRRRLEIEAKECEHAEKIASLSQQIAQGRHAMGVDTFPELQTETNRQFPAGEISQPVHPLPSNPNTKKPGRSPRLSQDFVVRASTLWREAISDSPNKVSLDQLGRIGSALDAAGHSPPSSYLEGKYARDLNSLIVATRIQRSALLRPGHNWSPTETKIICRECAVYSAVVPRKQTIRHPELVPDKKYRLSCSSPSRCVRRLPTAGYSSRIV